MIPCLDVADGRVVKGRRFRALRDAGDPVELAARYAREGADELVFLDITASLQDRGTIIEVVRRVAAVLDIPFTVGGGVRSMKDAYRLLRAGADKVAINTAAVARPQLLREVADEFGEQCVVLAIDAQETAGQPSGYEVMTHAARRPTGLDTVAWAQTGVQHGAGEILLTSVDRDGTRRGYDLDLTRRVATAIRAPVIASGGAGSMRDIWRVLAQGDADAALLASLLHFEALTVPRLKQYLRQRGVTVRT